MRTRRVPLFVASLVAALLTTGVAAVPGSAATAVDAAAPAAIADCSAPAWNAGSAYVGGNLVTHAGSSWLAKWWTQGEMPGTTGEWGVWEHVGACGGGEPPVDPPIDPPSTENFPVSQAQFEEFFPNRNSFYTYSGLVAALGAYPEFANSGSETIQKREAAAFLANVSHETGGLVHIVEQNTANYPHYCDTSQPYGCPAGHDQYYGKGPIQLSWNYNYKAAGDALGIDLLNNPLLVQTDAAIAWKTGLWYWNTQSGPGTMTPHAAIANDLGFGETIRSINGSIECNGGNPGQVQSRIDTYLRFTSALGVDPGSNLYC